MPSQRRVRVFFLCIFAGLIVTLLFTSHYRQTQGRDKRTLQDFYHKTVNAMDKSRGGGSSAEQKVLGPKKEVRPVDHDNDGDIDEDDAKLAQQMADRLVAAEQKAKDNANAKAPNKPDLPHEVVGVGSSAGGQKKDAKQAAPETDEEHEVEVELNSILKKSPMVIFSKSYCPYSKKAKGILLDKYTIDPAPFVVELDQHPLGPKLQAKLGEMTGRRTVPNVMVNGKSIGGGDDIAALDNNKDLASKIESLGAGAGPKRIKVSERFPGTAEKREQ